MILWFFTTATAASPPCLAEARTIVEHLWPHGAAAIATADAELFGTFLRCDSPDLGVRAAFHESIHAVSGRTPDGTVTLAQVEAKPLVLALVATMPASVVSTRLHDRERVRFHDHYLVGPAGEQALWYLMDELNAYVWTLELARRLQAARPIDARSSDRDGVVSLQWFLLTYLDALRTTEPDEYAAVVASEAHRTALTTLFAGATAGLGRTCADPHLGIDDGYWLKQVYGREGQRIFRKATGGSLELPDACAPLVAAAPQWPKAADPNAVVERAMLTRRTVIETFTIVVDGEELTLEEIEARAADDPKWTQVLEQVRAKLAEEPAPTAP